MKPPEFPLLRMGQGQETVMNVSVPVPEQGHTTGLLAVPSSSPRLLIVSLQAPRQLIVEHRTNVSPVDSHAEGVGGYHHWSRIV